MSRCSVASQNDVHHHDLTDHSEGNFVSISISQHFGMQHQHHPK